MFFLQHNTRNKGYNANNNANNNANKTNMLLYYLNNSSKNNDEYQIKNTNKYCKRINNNKIYSLIPLNIFQFWHTLELPVEIKKNVDILKLRNPDFTHYLYDLEMCRDFLIKNFDEDVVYTFDKIIPIKYKINL